MAWSAWLPWGAEETPPGDSSAVERGDAAVSDLGPSDLLLC
jgi:hypothetical protein